MSARQFDQHLKELISQESAPLPHCLHRKTEQTLANLPPKISKKRRTVPRTTAGLAACLLIFLFVIMPNISTTYAAALEELPLLGDLVRVFTIRSYHYDRGQRELDADIPEISDSGSATGSGQINQDIDTLTDTVIRQFYHDAALYDNKGYDSVTIHYETLTNTAQWFTLQLTISERSGSSNTFFKYYHIDRTTGNEVIFSDLFDESGRAALEKSISAKMKKEMSGSDNVMYWIEDNEMSEEISLLRSDQNFYFTENGTLVIVYNKYEVAPGSMGCPTFSFTRAEYAPFLSPHFLPLIPE